MSLDAAHCCFVLHSSCHPLQTTSCDLVLLYIILVQPLTKSVFLSTLNKFMQLHTSSVLIRATHCCSPLLGAAWCCLVLLGAAWCCLVLLGATLFLAPFSCYFMIPISSNSLLSLINYT
ncbi:hypothetical protein CANARDRAFT_148308 [[Candida] arabinofermentans NRRL YB-2248]|uniref:Uncharacterized protein n=1 Tax=[Candida] arabinofermentans NRRL YB-2248 TaxID=983967 RepID=A0A1E4T2I0_9ASCO|nr:hypothetical protein CANARDRAFT_148308 [[Candida] arabinofermentans NRRL YB-2248]